MTLSNDRAAGPQDATELHIGRLEDATIRVSLDPYLSVLALTTDALGGRRRGAPESLRRHIRSAVSPAYAQAVWPLVAPGHSVMPDCVSPLNPVLETSVDEQIERLRDLSPDDLLADLEGVFGSAPPPHWRAVARQPRQWLRAYAGATSQVWTAMRPAWRDARPLLDREVARVGAAAVRGRLDAVLGGIHPNGRFEDGILKIRDPEPARFELGDRPLVLVPMMSGSDALICSLDRPDAVWLGYPLPGAGRLFDGVSSGGERTNGLELLLGPVRAQLLGAVTRPITMGELAALTRLTPSAITYHCERLAAAGLVRRERNGREVRVTLTPRAEQLTELFDQ
jgi:DNA-binding transcriptional ArsR family regulator